MIVKGASKNRKKKLVYRKVVNMRASHHLSTDTFDLSLLQNSVKLRCGSITTSTAEKISDFLLSSNYLQKYCRNVYWKQANWVVNYHLSSILFPFRSSIVSGVSTPVNTPEVIPDGVAKLKMIGS